MNAPGSHKAVAADAGGALLAAEMIALGQRARRAAAAMARAGTRAKNDALIAIARELRTEISQLRTANARDVARATAAGLDGAALERLTLSDAHIEQMAAGLEQIVALPDPIGAISDLRPQPSGIEVVSDPTPWS